MKPWFAPSLMCMDLLNIKEQIGILNKYADLYHVDVMDGHYCENIAFSPDLLKAVKQVAQKPIDVHLMATDPMKWIEKIARAGADYISVHAETINTDAYRVLNQIGQLGCKKGVVLNPATPLEYVRHYLNRIDLLTIMTIDVGFAGQPFIEEMLEKIEEARRIKKEKGYHYKIQIDGSCNEKSFQKLYNAGTEVFILGYSGIFNLEDNLENGWKKMEYIFEKQTGYHFV